MKAFRYISSMLFLILLLICSANAIASGSGTILTDPSYIKLYSPAGTDEIKRWKEVKQDAEEDHQFVAWGESKNQSVKNTDLNREAQISAITFYGNPELVFKYTGFIDNEDTKGCLIDARTVKEIYGDVDPRGRTLTYNDQIYTIRGVIESDKQMILLPATSSTEKVIDMVYLDREGSNDANALDTFMSRYGLSGQKLDFRFYQLIVRLAIWLLPVILGIVTVLPFIRSLIGQNIRSQNFWILLGSMAGILVAFIWIIQLGVEIPQDFIPNRWSDFNFYINLWKEKMEALWTVVEIEKSYSHIALLKQLQSVLLYVLSALLAMAGLQLSMKKIGGFALFIYSLAAIITQFAITIHLGSTANASALLSDRFFRYGILIFLAAKCLRSCIPVKSLKLGLKLRLPKPFKKRIGNT